MARDVITSPASAEYCTQVREIQKTLDNHHIIEYYIKFQVLLSSTVDPPSGMTFPNEGFFIILKVEGSPGLLLYKGMRYEEQA
jgi:hypothetical protein